MTDKRDTPINRPVIFSPSFFVHESASVRDVILLRSTQTPSGNLTAASLPKNSDITNGPTRQSAVSLLWSMTRCGLTHLVLPPPNNTITSAIRHQASHFSTADRAFIAKKRPFFALAPIFEIADADLTSTADGFNFQIPADLTTVNRRWVGQLG